MRPVIVTRISGTGKTIALKMLEGSGSYYMDNLPISLVDKFAQLVAAGSDISQAALGTDIRSDEELNQLDVVLGGWRELEMNYQILFLDANDGVLIKRYKKTRCSHPLARAGRLDKGIEKERVKLAFLKKDADFIIGTSKLLTKELRQELEKVFLKYQEYCNVFVTVPSFGFKYSIPGGADLVLDVRFLLNPYYSEDLRLLAGEDQSVQSYVMQEGTYAQFLDKLYGVMDSLLPSYINERRNQLVVAVGCTEDRHRSVTVARALCAHPTAKAEYDIKIEHRGIDKNSKKK